MKKAGIIFDLDGTLWDVTESAFQSANIVAKKHNLEAISKEAICIWFWRRFKNKVFYKFNR